MWYTRYIFLLFKHRRDSHFININHQSNSEGKALCYSECMKMRLENLHGCLGLIYGNNLDGLKVKQICLLLILYSISMIKRILKTIHYPIERLIYFFCFVLFFCPNNVDEYRFNYRCALFELLQCPVRIEKNSWLYVPPLLEHQSNIPTCVERFEFLQV